MSISWMPAEYAQRPKSRSDQFYEKMGNLLEKGAGSFLQNKIESYFDEKKLERAEVLDKKQRLEYATGLSKLLNRPDLKEPLSMMPIQYQDAMAKEFSVGGTEDFISLLNKKTGPKGSYVPSFENQQTSQPSDVQKTIDIAQRLPQNIPQNVPQNAVQGLPPNLVKNALFQLPSQQNILNRSGAGMMQQGPQPPFVSYATQPTLPSQQMPAQLLLEPELEPESETPLADMTPSEFEEKIRQQPRRSVRDELRKERKAQVFLKQKIKKGDIEREKFDWMKEESVKERAHKDVSKFYEDINKSSESLTIQKNSLENAKAAIASGEPSSLYSYFIDKNGYDPLLPANTVRFKNAQKKSFLEYVRMSGSRPNQWIEQILLDSMAKIGRSQTANMLCLEDEIAQNDVKRARVRKAEELRKKYINDPNYGYVPLKVIDEVTDYSKAYAKKRFNIYSYRAQQLLENEKSDHDLMKLTKVPSGTPLTLRMYKIIYNRNNKDDAKAPAAAERMGFKVLPEYVYEYQYKKGVTK